MKNIKVEMSPPYRSDNSGYKSEVSLKAEFDNEDEALSFMICLANEISEFKTRYEMLNKDN